MRTTKSIIAIAIAVGFLSALSASAEKIDLTKFGTADFNLTIPPTEGTFSRDANTLTWQLDDTQDGYLGFTGSSRSPMPLTPEGTVLFTAISLDLNLASAYTGEIVIYMGSSSNGDTWMYRGFLDNASGDITLTLTHVPTVPWGDPININNIIFFNIQLLGMTDEAFNATFKELYANTDDAVIRKLEIHSDNSYTLETTARAIIPITVYWEGVAWTATAPAWITLARRNGGSDNNTGSITFNITVAANVNKERTGTITISGAGLTREIEVTQAGVPQPKDVTERPSIRTEYSVYETRISVRTSTIREMKVKIGDIYKPSIHAPEITISVNATVHFRAPVTKSYTILMAYSGEPGAGGITSEGFGRIWAAREPAIELRGEGGLKLCGKDTQGHHSFIGARMANIPESGNYTAADGSSITFEGLATMNWRDGIIASSTGTVYGNNFMPFGCTVLESRCPIRRNNPNANTDQGDLTPDVELFMGAILFSNVYYPRKCLASGSSDFRDAHFFGTYTTRYNAKLSATAKGTPTVDGRIDLDDFFNTAQRFIDGNVRGASEFQ